MKKFEPVIIGFVCNECVYAAADLAGTTRLPYPSNIRLIRIPCSGQVDIIHILRAFEKGADGVFIGGCLKEQCHYVDGNLKTIRKMPLLHLYMKQFGINPKRVKYSYVSASEGAELTEIVTEFVEEIKELGPNPIKGGN